MSVAARENPFDAAARRNHEREAFREPVPGPVPGESVFAATARRRRQEMRELEAALAGKGSAMASLLCREDDLDALRRLADESGTSVSEALHRLIEERFQA